MMHAGILAFHIGMGTLGVLMGAAALVFRKGSGPHRVVGTVFVLSMLFMGASASILAVMKPQPGLVAGGLMTIYFIATAWMAGRRKDGETGAFEIVAFVAALALAFLIAMGAYALATGATKAPNPVFPYVLYGISGAMVLAAAGDLSVIWRAGLSGAQRIARHLWRMCFGLFIAVGSFAAQGAAKVLPAGVGLPVLLVSMFLVLGVMAYWLVRVLLTKWYSRAEQAA
ncbi:MAG: hypothetical protein SGJ03_05080 [Alphaproteobacteria bacterium]|nr:hypothetical protein [Alphaproteobacteria bacterium]